MPKFRVNTNLGYNTEHDNFVFVYADTLPDARRKFLSENPTLTYGWVEELDEEGNPVKVRYKRGRQT